MSRDIIGIDVGVQFSDGTNLKGHISPIGTHIDSRQDDHERVRPVLEAMKTAVDDRLKPYRSKAQG